MQKTSTRRSDIRSSFCVLLTGFGPFPGAHFNPTAALVRKIARIRRPAFSDIRLVTHVFPTRYDAVDRELPALLAHYAPDVLVMFGLATRRKHLSIEICARNVTTTFPDAGGFSPIQRAILGSSPSKISPRLPTARLLRAARSRGMNAKISRDAGRYLCNYAYWRGIQACRTPGGPRLVVFIHIPPLSSNGIPTMRKVARTATLRDLAWAGEAILREMVSALR